MWRVSSVFEECEFRWRHNCPLGTSYRRFTDRNSAETWLRRFKANHNSMTVMRRILQASDRDTALPASDDDEVIEKVAGLLVSGRLNAIARVKVTAKGGGAPQAKASPPPPKSKKPKPAKEKKPEDKAEIVSVEFLNGDDSKILAKTGNQIVNMPRNKKWVDGKHVANIDRLSQKTRIRVKFNKEGSHEFKVRYLPDAKNVKYSPKEKGRNNNFKFQESEKTYNTGGKDTKVIPTSDFFVTAAGKDIYEVEAEHDGKKVKSSNKIETSRLVYYVEVKMRGLSITPDLKKVEEEFAKYNITLVSLGSVEMDHIPNLANRREENAMAGKAKEAYKGSKGPGKKPYVVVIGYTDHLAVKDNNRKIVKNGVSVGPGSRDVLLNTKGRSKSSAKLTFPSLWKNIVPGENWWISAKYLPDGGVEGTDDIPIDEADCTPIPKDPKVPDNCIVIRVKVSELPAGTGKLTLIVDCVKDMYGGTDFGGGSLINVCTRAWWINKSDTEQKLIAIHEIGHKIGMVPSGKSPKGLDKVTTHYIGKGHKGPHCYNPLSKKLPSYKNEKGSICVMFGETAGKTEFCPNCAPAVRKQDLSRGWPKF